jgi:2,4-dichlorophenol 6-monooxygenase
VWAAELKGNAVVDVEVPVLVVGGGGAGLTASMLLSNLGVDSLLVSASPTTSILPKAHVLNQRTMEILSDVGLASEIYRLGTPPEHMRATAFYTGFAGHPDAGRRIGWLEAWGAGGADPDWASASPCMTTNLPQIRLEPVLRARAAELSPGRVRFHHELVDLDQDDDAVTATVRDLGTDEDYSVRARYLLACDAGRTIGPALGVEMVGMRNAARAISIHMTTDLSAWATDPDVLIRWIWVPHMGSMAVLVPMGPSRWGPQSEEWVFHLNYPFDDPRALEDSQVEAAMRSALGIGDHPIEIHKITRWSLEGVVASSLRMGRVFFVGDAAHRHPPTGGLGLTSAVQDAHNVCWKLAAVLDGVASEALLDTYEPERRSSVQRNVDRSVENAMNHLATGDALGLLDPGLPAEEGWARVGRLWSDRPEDAAFRRQIAGLIASQSMEFREHNVEYGYTYESTAIVDDGSPAPEQVDPIRVYEPSTRPGSPLPHAWLDTDSGERISTLNLVHMGRFLLIAGEDGGPWCEAAARLAASGGIPLDVARIGHLDGDYLDPRCRWARLRQIGTDGAILVRPDRFVAWRSIGSSPHPDTVLAAALSRVLGRDLASNADEDQLTAMRS